MPAGISAPLRLAALCCSAAAAADAAHDVARASARSVLHRRHHGPESTTCARCVAKGASDWCWVDRTCYTSGPNPLNPCSNEQCASSSYLSYCTCRSCRDTNCSAAAPPPPVPPGAQGVCDEIRNDLALFHKLHALTNGPCRTGSQVQAI